MALLDFNKYLIIHVGKSKVTAKLNKKTETLTVKSGGYDFSNDLSVLESDLDKLIKLAKQKYRFSAVKVLISDPLVNNLFIDKATLPSNKVSQAKLIRARVEKEFQISIDMFSLTTQDPSKSNKVYAFILDKGLRNMFQSVIMENKLILRDLSLAHTSVSNQVDRYLKKKTSLVLFMDEDYWSVSVYQGRHQLDYFRSKWRTSELSQDKESIALNLRTYMSSNDGVDFHKAYFIGNASLENECCDYLKALTGKDVLSLNKKIPSPVMAAS